MATETDKLAKLLRLAFDPSATAAEAELAAVMLVRHCRSGKLSFEAAMMVMTGSLSTGRRTTTTTNTPPPSSQQQGDWTRRQKEAEQNERRRREQEAWAQQRMWQQQQKAQQGYGPGFASMGNMYGDLGGGGNPFVDDLLKQMFEDLKNQTRTGKK